MTASYDGLDVVVTGAATGVGAALVPLLREAGAASITGVDRKPVDGVDTFHEVDLSDPASVEDLVGTLSYLASDDSAFMTGQTLSIDGGYVRL